GRVTGVARGSATIAAAFGDVSGNTTVTVTSAALVSIAVTPSNQTLADGLTQQYVAMGTFSDGSLQDVTAQVIWSSTHSTVASISNAASSHGLASTLAPGVTAIAAQLGGINSQPVTLTVTAATLATLQVSPANPSVPLGATQAFKATGVYTDNTTQD